MLLIEEYLNSNSLIMLLIIIISSTIVIYNYLRPLKNINLAHSYSQKIHHFNLIESIIISILTLLITII
jgi:hypothetical protein